MIRMQAGNMFCIAFSKKKGTDLKLAGKKKKDCIAYLK